MLTEPLAVTLTIADILEKLDVPYALGGSLASAVYGVPRATMDADIITALKPEHTAPFVSRVKNGFYADESTVKTAILQKTSFNLIHLETMFKIDIFVAKADPLDTAQLAHRIRQQVGESPSRHIFITSPEDTLLAKLVWYRNGGEVSDRQWRDIEGIINVQKSRLDVAYLREMAVQLKIDDLFERLFGRGDGGVFTVAASGK